MMITEDVLRKALNVILPPMDPNTVTVSIVLAKLATQLNTSLPEIKESKTIIKAMIMEMIELCHGGQEKENDETDGYIEEDVHMPTKPMALKQRNRNVIESDNDSSSDGNLPTGSTKNTIYDSDVENASNNENRVKKRRKNTPVKTVLSKKTKSVRTDKISVAARKDSVPSSESARFKSLMDYARAAGMLNPRTYKILKEAGDEQSKTKILYSRFEEAGLKFTGDFPSKAEIAALKAKTQLKKDLDGIDPSVIITHTGRPRRGASLQPTFHIQDHDVSDERDESDCSEASFKFNGASGSESE